MTLKTINETDIHHAIRKLENGRTAGPDKIPRIIIKEIGVLISKASTMIFNSSLRNTVFPDIWKIERNTPTFNSSAKEDVNNYRTISVISFFSRILERLVYYTLYEFLSANKVIARNQSVFQNYTPRWHLWSVAQTLRMKIQTSEN